MQRSGLIWEMVVWLQNGPEDRFPESDATRRVGLKSERFMAYLQVKYITTDT